MKLIILGKEAKDKGSQLEKLTTYILESQGYKNIDSNILVCGGEIDVAAEFIQPIGGEQRISKVMCECKALKEPVNITAWYKFLGKYHVAFLSDSSAIGVLIALSGVNGNVSGSYNEVKEKNKNVILITGDRLLDLIKKRYEILEPHIIQEHVFTNIKRRVSVASIAYYDNNVYWLLSFESGDYTILNKDGSYVAKTDHLCDMIEDDMSYSNYIDLNNEIGYRHRQIHIDKFVISQLIKNGTNLSIHSLLATINSDHSDYLGGEVFEAELEQIASNNEFVTISNGNCALAVINNDNIICFYRYLLNYTIPVSVVKSALYQSFITIDLLREIEKIQCNNISINEDDEEDYLFLLKHSPTALAYAVSPDMRITQHAIPKYLSDAIVGYTHLFRETIKDGFIQDYNRQDLHSLFLDDWQINRVHIKSSITIEAQEKTRNLNSSNNLILARLDNVSGNPVALVSKFIDE